jgi:hypothetical protein
MREKGILKQIMEKHESPRQMCPDYSGTPLGLDNCFTAFLVILIGLGCSLCFGICEMITKK